MSRCMLIELYLIRQGFIITMNCEQNMQLQEKYITNGSFMNQMIGISKKFKEFEQQSYYSQLEESSKSMIIAILADSELAVKLNNHQELDYFVVMGAKQPSGNNGIEKTLLNIIHLIPRPKKAYSIIYINTLAAKNSFDDFKKVTEFLPIQYFLNLGKIYVLNASFLSRATSWITFSIITNYVKQKTIHANDFQELSLFTKLNPNQLIRLLPEEIQKELAKKEEFVEHLIHYATKMLNFVGIGQNRKLQTTQMIRTKKQEKAPQKVPHYKITPQKEIQLFQSSVSKSSIVFVSYKKASKRHIQDYQIGQSGAPLPLQTLLYFFNQRDDFLNTEGIFRKSVSIDDQNELLAQIDDENYDFIQHVTDPHLIANAIKRFLSYLILPIVPYPQYMKMMQAQPDKFTQAVIHTIQGLSQLRKKTMLIVLEFMKERVIPKQSTNKMNVKNISIVIGPCLMHSEVSSIRDLVYSQKIISVMLIIFKEFDVIFGNKKERKQALRKSAENYGRAYLQERLGRFQQKINDPILNAAQLTPQQFMAIQPKFTKREQIQKQYQSSNSNSNSKLLRKVTHSLKQQLVQSIQKHEEEELQEASHDENANQLKKKIEHLIVDIGEAKLSQQYYLDI